MVYGEISGYGFPVLSQVPCLETDPGEICGRTRKGCTQALAAVLFYKDAVLERSRQSADEEMGCELRWVRPRHGHHPRGKNDSAHTVWGYYRHSAGDATERSRGSKPPKVSWKRLTTDTDLPGICFHFLLCGFHKQGQGDERGLLLRPTDGKPPVNLLASGFLHKHSRKISEVNCDHNSLSLWQHG